jgi:hypothetical protein
VSGQLSLGALGGIVLAPDVLEEQRGAWCSPVEYTAAASSEHHFDLDPFTNPRSTLRAVYACMLERGGDGFGLDQSEPGAFYIAPDSVIGSCLEPCCHGEVTDRAIRMVATADWRVWIQPPYDIVLEVLAHYGHTRFVALLRLDTSTVWFSLLFWGIRDEDLADPEMLARLTKALKHTHKIEQRQPLCEVVMVPKQERIEFVPPPGVKASSNPFPHGLFYKRAEDVPAAIRALCYPWPTAIYPWAADPLGLVPRKRRRTRAA